MPGEFKRGMCKHEKKLTQMEKERPDEMEMAEKENEEGKKKENESINRKL